jgi:hypothetical protein
MIPFIIGLIWTWSFVDLFESLPNYGDVLEVIWGITWYSRSLWSSEISPLFTPLVFHPLGWHTATLAHTPFLFSLGVPLHFIGGSAFAYNLLAILSLFVAYLGSLKFLELHLPKTFPILGAFIYTFAGVRSAGIVRGHLHISWASSLFPWLSWSLFRFAFSENQANFRKYVVISGFLWGLMVNFSLYAAFLGGMLLLVLGRRLLDIELLKSFFVVAGIAILVGNFSVIPYLLGKSIDHPTSFGITHVIHWGASLNSLISPYVLHPLPIVKALARRIYSGALDESGVANMGVITLLLALIGSVYIMREKRERAYGLVVLSLVGLLLSLGPFLKWDGMIVESPAFEPVVRSFWRLGHLLKPDLFSEEVPHRPYLNGIPLPGLVLTVVIPFWESARTVSRFALIGYLGLVALAAYGMWRIPYNLIKFLLLIALLVESLPPRSGQVPMPSTAHPAYQWLKDQRVDDGVGIVDFVYPTIHNSGETLFATVFHETPTASGVGSFWPSHTFSLWDYFLQDDALLNEDAAHLLDLYDIRYIFLHIRGEYESSMWGMIAQNTGFHRIDCFEPLDTISPWSYPICVAEIRERQSRFANVLLHNGWSVQESWGIWANETNSQAEWFADKKTPYRLVIEAFPNCSPDMTQSMLIEVNGLELKHYQWEGCETIRQEFVIPKGYITLGRNRLNFSYRYAVEPSDPDSGKLIDSRTLSVGFSTLKVTNP